MPTYAVAHLRNVTMGPQIVEYLQRIDSTLEPFAGRLLVHGGKAEVLEGVWPGHVSSPTASEPAHGTNRPPTRRSRRCAGTTPRAMSFSPIGYLNSIGRRTYWPGGRGARVGCVRSITDGWNSTISFADARVKEKTKERLAGRSSPLALPNAGWNCWEAWCIVTWP